MINDDIEEMIGLYLHNVLYVKLYIDYVHLYQGDIIYTLGLLPATDTLEKSQSRSLLFDLVVPVFSY